MIDEITGK